ncbi:hypothetical protein FACS1894177_05350 [Bacteroidia bacterium]|nr:hypothetical protein FACS1894177_05350 [Bacteroidia bacterium]
MSMDTSTKIMEIFESRAKKFVKMYESIEKETNSYEFEQTVRSEIESLGHILYQEMTGESSVSISAPDKSKTLFLLSINEIKSPNLSYLCRVLGT